MNDNEYIARTVCEKLGNGSSLVLVSIVSLQGSSPRHRGTKMVVDEQGKSYGTIGGSLLEATVINDAVAVLSEKQSRLMSFDLNGYSAYSKDMICGGKAEILLDFIPGSKENLDLFTALHDTIRTGRDLYFLTAYRDYSHFVEVLGHTLFTPNGKAIGNYSWKDSDLDVFKSESKGLSSTTVLKLADIRVVIDPIKKIETLFCFGAGHVAMPTAHVAAIAGFRVVVVDDRADYVNTERFPDADELCIINDFNHALKGLTIDADSYIVIVTRGHAFDRVVLAEALKTKAGYIGMISSRRKRDAIYQALMDEGVSKDALARVHSPIGIPIGGETPAEISISIVAELISERYKKKS
jgi:xanthine dehydrogenase accessory factor